MTEKELESPFRLNRELDKLKGKLKDARNYAFTGGALFYRTPTNGNSSIDRTADTAIEIAQIEEQIRVFEGERLMCILHLWLEIEELKSCEERQLLKLRHLDCLTFAEIAKIEGKTEGAARQQYSRLMKRLEKEHFISNENNAT